MKQKPFPKHLEIQACHRPSAAGVVCSELIHSSPFTDLKVRVRNVGVETHDVIVHWFNALDPKAEQRTVVISQVAPGAIRTGQVGIMEQIEEGAVRYGAWEVASVQVDGVNYPVRDVPLKEWRFLHMDGLEGLLKQAQNALCRLFKPTQETRPAYVQTASRKKGNNIRHDR